MELSTQINYHGYKADYSIFSFNSELYYAQLNHFFGNEASKPPEKLIFIKSNNHVIASSDVIFIAVDLTQKMNGRDATIFPGE
jgi:hypothetical protein